MVAAAAGAAGIAVIVGFIVSGLFGAGGAETPEGAVTALAEAISAEDPAAALSIMAPDEVRMVSTLLADSEEKAADLGFLSGDDAYAGVELELTGLQLRVVNLSEDVAKVVIEQGSVTYSIVAETLAERTARYVESASGSFTTADAAEPLVGSGLPFVMVVRSQGNWYVSPFYTFFEAISQYQYQQGFSALAVPAHTPTPAENPEMAMRQFVEAAASGQVTRLIGTIPVGEAAPLLSYPLLANDLLSSLLRDVGDGGGLIVNFDSLNTEVQEIGGDMAIVSVLTANMSTVAQDGRRVPLELSGTCGRVSDPDSGEDRGSCLGDEWPIGVPGEQLGELRFVAVQVDGGWLVSPVGSLAETARSIVEDISEPHFTAYYGLR